VLVLAFFALTTFANFYTDVLWYQRQSASARSTAGCSGPRSACSASSALLMAAVVAVNMVVAFRLRPLFHPQSPEQTGLDRYRQAVTPIRTWLVLGARVLLGIFAGTSGRGSGALHAVAQRRAVQARGRLLPARTSASSSSTCPGTTSSSTS
jgi:hypothetical protein